MATFTSAVAVCASTLAFAVPGAGASATGLAPGNLLVSTSQYSSVPNITAGSTTLPISGATAFVTNVTSSGTAPNIVATITTAAKDGLKVGSSVTIAGVGGATQVNGTFTVASVPSTTQFTISLGSTTVSPYTSGGSTTLNTTTTAVAPGTYPLVFNNASADANFGVTEPIVLDQIPATTTGPAPVISQITVPHDTTGDQMVTSFSSKSELALNQSTDGSQITFMGYNAPTGAIDVSNSNTPIEIDPTNSDVAGATPSQGYYRDVAAMDANGNFQFTETGAYGGNNGRAAILNSANGTIYTAGNAGNGANPPYQGVVIGSGSQILSEAFTSQAAQESAGIPTPTPFGNFNITQLSTTATPVAADKPTKDDNFRGLTEYNGVIYMSKGSGGNGVNTVYFVDTTGTACPAGSAGVGVPQAGATLPSASSWSSSPLAPAFNTSNTALGLSPTNPGLSPTNMCILNGFPTTLASASSGVSYPFGMWFANPTTLYVADEGSGTFPASSTDTTGGLQKWTLNTATNTWGLDYTLSNGLALKSTYTVADSTAAMNINNTGTAQSYPTGLNSTDGGKSGNWAPATDGLRNIVGQINGDGTVTIWATTSTISGSGDEGTDPNQVVAITDSVGATTLPGTESFTTVMPATDGVVYRGVSFTPTTPVPNQLPEAVWVPLIPLTAVAIGGGFLWRRNRRQALPLV